MVAFTDITDIWRFAIKKCFLKQGLSTIEKREAR